MQINNKYNFSNDKIRDIRNIKINENRRFPKDESKEYILTNINSICIKD